MLTYTRPSPKANNTLHNVITTIACLVLGASFFFATLADCMSNAQIADLKQDARYIFYHGMTNYHHHAFPDDELRPITCSPLTRDRLNPHHIEVNDVLGNYSLSLVDSLSTLAILASSPTSDHDPHNALEDFQKYVALLVDEYGDGTDGQSGQGKRARGFDLDSKVQVFETTIRGVGGLLSAHLFAVGDLPIRNYAPVQQNHSDGRFGILWIDGFVYDGQLLRLATDLARRLLPAFHTPTGIPYPRVNLRQGVPFYENSPLNNDPFHGQCKTTPRSSNEHKETTETCSAGASSLVLEFTVLSRLTGDPQYERLAKKAFWAVWERRSASGLLGAGIDAETGAWIGSFTGIGAGIDSFFEYAFKSHVLLSGSHYSPDNWLEDSPEAFLQTWQDAHAAVTRHIRRHVQFQHPHYAQNDLWTGGLRLSWIDSLSAYYPGLLAFAGEIEEASTVHLLYTALWTRYGALPERWNAHTGAIDNGLCWWGGRPEFIESTWYLYRATQDPWYLHVGEMALRDIKRRCWTKCGWAGLQDVRTGEQTDRMESFFLGETAKYLYLLFDTNHPLNHLDAPWVFTTEGHPLIIPKRYRLHSTEPSASLSSHPWLTDGQCPVPPQPLPFTVSPVAARPDVFHAASLARLHLMPRKDTPPTSLLDFSADHPSVTMADVSSPNNYTYYPWTLPPSLIPPNATSSKMAVRPTYDLSFPSLPSASFDFGALQKVDGGILINSMSGLRFGMILEEDAVGDEYYRIHSLSNIALGKDENLYFASNTLSQINPTDPHFTRMRDTEILDLLIDVPPPFASSSIMNNHEEDLPASLNDSMGMSESFNVDFTIDLDPDLFSTEHTSDFSDAILSQFPQAVFEDADRLAEQLDSLVGILPGAVGVDKALRDAADRLRSGTTKPPSSSSQQQQPDNTDQQILHRYTLQAMLPTGPGAASLPLSLDTSPDHSTLPLGSLPYQSILLLDTDLCPSSVPELLPPSLFTQNNILVVRRGGCSFSQKLARIPSFPPSPRALQMLVVVSFPEHEDGGGYGRTRPLLDEKQMTPRGVERRNEISFAMVSGGKDVWDVLERAASAVGVVDEDGKIEITRREQSPSSSSSSSLASASATGETSGANGVESKRSSSSWIPGGSKTRRKEGEEKEEARKKSEEEKMKMKPGMGIRRRYYWSSQGIRISNLHMMQ